MYIVPLSVGLNGVCAVYKYYWRMCVCVYMYSTCDISPRFIINVQ